MTVYIPVPKTKQSTMYTFEDNVHESMSIITTIVACLQKMATTHHYPCVGSCVRDMSSLHSLVP